MLERILVAAEECFRKYGIQRTRMDDVARTIGLARPNLYRFVPSKDALIQLVNMKHTAAVDSQRRQRIPIEGPVSELLVRSLVMGVAIARRDEFALDLLTGANTDFAARTLALSGEDPILPRPAYWYPILDHGRARGEVRPDLSNGQIVRWLGMMSLLFVQQPDLFPDEASVEWYCRQFVVPSLLSSAQPVSLETKASRRRRASGVGA
jgi:AcrR family transcriptional regulator